MSTIATKISLVQYSGPIFDQGMEGSCTANQICGAITLQANEYGVSISPLSRQQLYNDTRAMMGEFNVDGGSVPSIAHYIATHNGIANESSFNYGPDNLYVHPTADVELEASTQKVTSFTDIPTEQNYTSIAKAIGNYLMQGKTILVDATVHYGFGVDLNSITNPINGGHSYLIVGIDSSNMTYTVQNSWGTNWADNGYGTIKWTDLPGFDPMNRLGSDLRGLSVINGFNGVDVEWTQSRKDVSMLYTTLLDRCPEKAGEYYFADLVKNGMSLLNVAKGLVSSQEGHSLYDSMSNKQFVDFVYHNTTGQQISEGNESFFVKSLDMGVDRGLLAYTIVDQVNHSKDATIHDFLVNKITVGMNYSTTFQIDGTHSDIAHSSIDLVTNDANGIEAILTGIQNHLHGIGGTLGY